MKKQNGFLTLKVITYHGDPYDVDGIPTLASSTITRDVPGRSPNKASSVNHIDDVVRLFQNNNGCMINYDDAHRGSLTFEIFEPSWPTSDIAKVVGSTFLNDLMRSFDGHQNDMHLLS